MVCKEDTEEIVLGLYVDTYTYIIYFYMYIHRQIILSHSQSRQRCQASPLYESDDNRFFI